MALNPSRFILYKTPIFCLDGYKKLCEDTGNWIINGVNTSVPATGPQGPAGGIDPNCEHFWWSGFGTGGDLGTPNKDSLSSVRAVRAF
ncbi:MAG: hypothetical protein FWD36_08705 [Treponema sp.]|nr:hypothetical protein [Treponema sp.]